MQGRDGWGQAGASNSPDTPKGNRFQLAVPLPLVFLTFSFETEGWRGIPLVPEWITWPWAARRAIFRLGICSETSKGDNDGTARAVA